MRNGHKEVAEKLLEFGADVDVAYPDGVTPLVMACNRGYPAIVDLLLRNGADIHARYEINHR